MNITLKLRSACMAAALLFLSACADYSYSKPARWLEEATCDGTLGRCAGLPHT